MKILHTAFHPQSPWSNITVVLCWGLLAYLTGTLVGVVFAAFVLVVLLGFAKALLKRHKPKNYLAFSIIENIHTITYAVTAGLLVLTLVGLLIPADALLTVYVLQLILAVPALLVVHVMIHYLHHLFLNQDPRFISSLLIGVLKTAIVVSLMIGAMAFGTYNAMSIAKSQQEAVFSDIRDVPTDVAESELLVLQEMAVIWETSYEVANRPEILCTVCAPSAFLEDTVQRVEALLHLQFLAQIYNDNAQQLSALEQTPAVFLEQQLAVLQANVDDNQQFFAEPESIFGENPTIEDLWEQFGSNQQLPAPIDSGIGLVFDDAPLHRSMEYAAQHTILYEDGLAYADRILSMDIVLRPKLIVQLYKNRHVSETLDSKLIRYSILSGYVNQRKDAPRLIA